MHMPNIIKEVIRMLDTAERLGSDTDEPEGNRYIQISDTLAKKLSDDLKQRFKFLDDHPNYIPPRQLTDEEAKQLNLSIEQAKGYQVVTVLCGDAWGSI